MTIPFGYCHCGCGNKTNPASRTVPRLGYIKGQPMKYLCGHGRVTMPVGSTQPPNPSGLCMCGCGRKTPIAIYTSHQAGNVNGFPRRFCVGHGGAYRHFVTPHNPEGVCMCGCGNPTKASPLSRIDRGYAAGQPMNYLHNHHGRRVDYIVEDRGYKTPCWIWQKHKDKDGYARMAHNMRPARAHRVYYEKRFGKIPGGYEVDHLCHVTCCVNPDHLCAVTPIVNQRNKSSNKLSPEMIPMIKAMRDSGETFAKIAAKLGVNHRTIRNAYLGLTWGDAKVSTLNIPPVGLSS